MFLRESKGISMNTDSINEYIEKHFSEKRRVHTEGVRTTAIRLAEKYGADPKKAEIAALYHDMFRGVDKETLNRKIDELGLPDRYRDNPNLAHGKLAALIMERDFDIKDQDILNAVSFHTTGRPGMSPLEKVVFIADAIEPGRDYPGVEELRKLADEDIDKACLLSLTRTAEYVLDQGNYLDEDTLHAKEYFEKILKEKVMDNKSLAMEAAHVLDAKQAIDITIIDVAEKSSFADYLIIASGGSERQVGALADSVEDKFAENGILPKSIEGKQNSGWMLMDYGDIIVNIFSQEMREKYNIEKVWGDCNFLDIE